MNKTDIKPDRLKETERLKVYEYPQPWLEILDKEKDIILTINTVDEALMIRDSLNEFLNCIPKQYGGEGE